jgi:hypothetical protein
MRKSKWLTALVLGLGLVGPAAAQGFLGNQFAPQNRAASPFNNAQSSTGFFSKLRDLLPRISGAAAPPSFAPTNTVFAPPNPIYGAEYLKAFGYMRVSPPR